MNKYIILFCLFLVSCQGSGDSKNTGFKLHKKTTVILESKLNTDWAKCSQHHTKYEYFFMDGAKEIPVYEYEATSKIVKNTRGPYSTIFNDEDGKKACSESDLADHYSFYWEEKQP
jgi:hypothetical protein